MAIPVLVSTAQSAPFAWAQDPSVTAPDEAVGWVPLADCTVSDGADVIEIAPLSGEQLAVVNACEWPRRCYEAARAAVRVHRPIGERDKRGAQVEHRGEALRAWISGLPFGVAFECFIAVMALTNGQDVQDSLRRVHERLGDG
jgi:hypothetical protein